MRFSNIKIGVLLGLGFFFIIACGLASAIFGSARLNHIEDRTTELVEDRMVKVERLNAMLDDLNIITVAIRDIALTPDEQEMQASRAEIEQARGRVTTEIKALHDTINLAEAKPLMDQVEQLDKAFTAASDKAIALGLANRQDEARQMLNKEVRPAQLAYFKQLDALIDLEKRVMNANAKDVQETAGVTMWIMLAVALIAAAIGAMVAFVITRAITGPVNEAVEVAHAVAGGNLTHRVDGSGSNEFAQLLQALGGMQQGLVDVVSRVRSGSESVATASAQIAQGNQDLSARTESQASALQQTAASMEELGSTVRHNADNARQANQLAQSASTVALQGGEVVAQVVQTMRGIDTASHKIEDIIGVIDGIAFQTNILALNAAVEAARAGEQGRGFAVVASEVRSLAGRSAEAAKEIKRLILDSTQQVAQGTRLVDQAGTTMEEVVTSIRRVTDLMGEISAATSEQSAGVNQVGEAVMQMDQATQQNAALVEEMAAAASSLRTQASDLVGAVAVFQLQAQSSAHSAHSTHSVSSTHSAPIHRPAPVAAPHRTAPKAAPKAVPKPAPQTAAPRRAPAIAAKPSPTLASRPAPAATLVKPRPVHASAGGDGDWESF